MEVAISKGAQKQIKDTAVFYSDKSHALGEGFLQIIENSFQEIQAFPYASFIIREPYRRFLTKKFPFGIIYRIENERIFIVTVMHLKQKPFFWLNEIKFFEV
mgnify:CR=1 FL=1